jgi:hypothetical protein
MNLSDILRELIDKLENLETGTGTDDTADTIDTGDDQPVMMPPQTQKLELLKKAVGVESEFDDAEDMECDEITQIRKNAGINPAVISSMGDDTLE